LLVGGFTNDRQAVVRFDDLPRPVVTNGPVDKRRNPPLERRVGIASVVLLAGLVILSTSDHAKAMRRAIDAHVAVRRGRVPVAAEKTVVALQRSRRDVAGEQFKTRL